MIINNRVITHEGSVEYILDQSAITGNLKLKVIGIDDYFAAQGTKSIYPTIEVTIIRVSAIFRPTFQPVTHGTCMQSGCTG